MNIQKYIRPTIKTFPEISWGEAAYSEENIILKWGENPYSPPLKVCERIQRSFLDLNRYPNQMRELQEQLSIYTSCPTEQICLTNGSDKAFRLLAEVFIDVGDEVITFTPSYMVINSAIELMGGKVINIPLTDNYQLPRQEIIKASLTKKTKCIYVCNPNNPTGNFIASNEEIEELLQLNMLIIVDEAYFEIAQQTALCLLKKYPNLIILRSFSKTFGLAGLRVGYLLSSPEIIKNLRKVEESLEIFNISSPSLCGAIAGLEERETVFQSLQKIKQTKNILSNEMRQLQLYPYPSQTTFMLFDTKQLRIPSAEFLLAMAKEKIILKDCAIYEGLDQYKVYMGIPHEKDLERVIQAIKKVCQNYLLNE